jgi:hypothetical protein
MISDNDVAIMSPILWLQIFGATEDDVAALQIVSLQEVDLGNMDAMFDDMQ